MDALAEMASTTSAQAVAAPPPIITYPEFLLYSRQKRSPVTLKTLSVAGYSVAALSAGLYLLGQVSLSGIGKSKLRKLIPQAG